MWLAVRSLQDAEQIPTPKKEACCLSSFLPEPNPWDHYVAEFIGK